MTFHLSAQGIINSAVATSNASADFAQYMRQVALILLGEPNPKHSQLNKPRWGTNGSLKVDIEKGTWHNFEQNIGGGVLDLIIRHGVASTYAEAVKWLEAKGIHKSESQTIKAEKPKPIEQARVVKRYDYTDECGKVLYQVERLEPKAFRQRRPQSNGGWAYNGLSAVRKVPYRLQHLTQQTSAIIFITEGEKDADNLAAIGLIATCTAGGAGKWDDGLTQFFVGRDVVVLPDNDQAGEKHCNMVVKKLAPVVSSIRVLKLPSLGEKGDVSDWLDGGGTADELVNLAMEQKAVCKKGREKKECEQIRILNHGHFANNLALEDWTDLDTRRRPIDTMSNVQDLLDYYRILARYNDTNHKLEIDIPLLIKKPIKINTAISMIKSLARRNGLRIKDMEECIEAIADTNSYHPGGDFVLLRGWDGRSRGDALLESMTIKEGFCPKLAAKILRRWLISAVAAIFNEGAFSSKGVLVFQGDQSLGKTRWFKSLLPRSYQHLFKQGVKLNPNNKDSVIDATSRWLVEFGELDSTFKKSYIGDIKSFIDKEEDELRRPYQRLPETYKRRTVFCASVNAENFLVDETGNSRFWTIPVTGLNYNHGIDMQQLWAEVYTWYLAGEKWWFDADEEIELNQANQEHALIDPIEQEIDTICDWSNSEEEEVDPIEVTSVQLLRAIGYNKPNKRQVTRCTSILNKRFKMAGLSPRKTSGVRYYKIPIKAQFAPCLNASSQLYLHNSSGIGHNVRLTDFHVTPQLG